MIREWEEKRIEGGGKGDPGVGELKGIPSKGERKGILRGGIKVGINNNLFLRKKR